MAEQISMFDEMKAAGSSLPDKVRMLQAAGWKTYQHHDNWIHSDFPHGMDTHAAYEAMQKYHVLSIVDRMKPMVEIFNKRQAGEKLTDDENAMLDGGFPVLEAYKSFVEELNKRHAKYFHPDIVDIRPGYKCEKIIHAEYDTHITFPNPNVYAKYTLDATKCKSEPYVLTNEDIINIIKFDGDLRSGKGLPIIGFYRTPYLTIQHLEDRGWTYIETRKPGNFDEFPLHIFKKKLHHDNCMDCFAYDWTLYAEDASAFGQHPLGEIIIEETKSGGFAGIRRTRNVYSGNCKCPNTFDYLCKLLKINNEKSNF